MYIHTYVNNLFDSHEFDVAHSRVEVCDGVHHHGCEEVLLTCDQLRVQRRARTLHTYIHVSIPCVYIQVSKDGTACMHAFIYPYLLQQLAEQLVLLQNTDFFDLLSCYIAGLQ